MAEHVLHSSLSSQWFTPPKVLDREREALGGEFDLDPASCAEAQQLVRAERWHAVDGLRVPWRARRLHLNGPYSRKDGGPISRWVERALLVHLDQLPGEYVRSGCLVVNATPGPRWFRWLWQVATIAMLDERVEYIEPVEQAVGRWREQRRKALKKTSAKLLASERDQLLERGARGGLPVGLTPGPSPTHWSAVAYVGDDPARFARAFRTVATIIPAGSARVSEAST